ncbi:hypothetical protein C8F01DRAFT_1290276 [Mycena amicta]|nr:hypothetical protein C8F01DRAFT_1290276 [Mycena amicta]
MVMAQPFSPQMAGFSRRRQFQNALSVYSPEEPSTFSNHLPRGLGSSSVTLGGTEQRKVADWCEGGRIDGRKHSDRWSIRLWKTGLGWSRRGLSVGLCRAQNGPKGLESRVTGSGAAVRVRVPAHRAEAGRGGRGGQRRQRRAEAAEVHQAESAWVQPASGYSQALRNPVKPAPGTQIWIVQVSSLPGYSQGPGSGGGSGIQSPGCTQALFENFTATGHNLGGYLESGDKLNTARKLRTATTILDQEEEQTNENSTDDWTQ